MTVRRWISTCVIMDVRSHLGMGVMMIVMGVWCIVELTSLFVQLLQDLSYYLTHTLQRLDVVF